MARTLLISLTVVFVASFLTLNAAKKLDTKIDCAADVPQITLNEKDKRYPLYEQAIQYLQTWSEKVLADDVITSTATDKTESLKTLEKEGDNGRMWTMAKQVEKMVTDKDALLKCFDPIIAGSTVTYSISSDAYTQAQAWKLQRTAISDTSIKKSKVGQLMVENAQGWEDKLAGVPSTANSFNPTGTHKAVDFSPSGSKLLWQLLGWTPMYPTRAEAGNTNFRGMYVYGEVLGPMGLIRVAKVDGVKFEGDIGLTYQGPTTTYNPHFHNAQELYYSLSADDDATTAAIQPRTDKKEVAWTGKSMKVKQYTGLYMRTNAIHAFKVGGSKALFCAWARSKVHTLSQNTNICAEKAGSYTCRAVFEAPPKFTATRSALRGGAAGGSQQQLEPSSM